MRILTGLLLTLSTFGQVPEFEVASIKAYPPGQIGVPRITSDPGRLKAEGVDLKMLIAYAYDASPLVIIGNLPATRFDVEGRAEGAHSGAELRLMLRALLSSRFGLQLHRQLRALSVDALAPGKSANLHPSDATEPDPRGIVLRSGTLRNHVAVEGHAISLSGLANYLSNHHRDRLIVDTTGLEGVYDFSVEYEVDIEKITERSVPVAEATASLMDGLVSALGLKIESGRRLPVEMIIVDRISPPDPN